MFRSSWWQRSREWRPRVALIGAMAAALASAHCGDAGQGGAGGTAHQGDAGQDGAGGKEPVDPAICHPPASVSGAPQTIEDVTALINALASAHGGKVELPCFVASLDRPLGATASAGHFSAQPASNPRSPRMFLWSGALVMSVVPEGTGKDLLELGYQTAPTRSVKAEIQFPVTAPLSEAAPYDRVLNDASTSKCQVCHANEAPATSVTWAKGFESDVLRPVDTDLVALGDVALESTSCDPAVEPYRCALLRAIFDQGGLQLQAFSPDALTIFGD